MNATNFTLPALLALAAAPAMAQCGPGHSGHAGHSRTQDHARPQEGGPKVKATNTICPVMGQPVKPGRDREVVIRGNQYLVCCDGCGPEMSEHYDKYLDPDGRPLNDPKRDPKAEPKKETENPTPAPAAHEGHHS
ncbi:MAG TPA: hypothetical protein VGK03_03635 [Geothrix sp.]|jgi:hypothetical protein